MRCNRCPTGFGLIKHQHKFRLDLVGIQSFFVVPYSTNPLSLLFFDCLFRFYVFPFSFNKIVAGGSMCVYNVYIVYIQYIGSNFVNG